MCLRVYSSQLAIRYLKILIKDDLWKETINWTIKSKHEWINAGMDVVTTISGKGTKTQQNFSCFTFLPSFPRQYVILKFFSTRSCHPTCINKDQTYSSDSCKKLITSYEPNWSVEQKFWPFYVSVLSGSFSDNNDMFACLFNEWRNIMK